MLLRRPAIVRRNVCSSRSDRSWISVFEKVNATRFLHVKTILPLHSWLSGCGDSFFISPFVLFCHIAMFRTASERTLCCGLVRLSSRCWAIGVHKLPSELLQKTTNLKQHCHRRGRILRRRAAPIPRQCNETATNSSGSGKVRRLPCDPGPVRMRAV